MEEARLTESQASEYLKAIGAALDEQQRIAPDLETLSRLIDAHQTHIPFQTVTISRLGQQPTLGMDDLYEKIVVKGWGGYCFELNKLFEALLRSLGYGVRPIFSRSVRGRDVRMPINHRAMLVDLPVTQESGPDDSSQSIHQLLYVDVGFGGPLPSGALILEDGLEQDFSTGTFIPVLIGPGHWRIDRITRGSNDNFDDASEPKTQTEIELYDYEVEDIDFELLNKALSSPGSLFRDTALANLRTPNGHKSLRDNVLTVRENGRKKVIELEENELPGALEEHFGLKSILV